MPDKDEEQDKEPEKERCDKSWGGHECRRLKDHDGQHSVTIDDVRYAWDG